MKGGGGGGGLTIVEGREGGHKLIMQSICKGVIEEGPL